MLRLSSPVPLVSLCLPLLLVAAAPTVEGTAPVDVQEPPATVFVDIGLDGTRITYSVDPVYVAPGDLIVWRSDLPFSVRFKGDTPIYGGFTAPRVPPVPDSGRATLRFNRAARVRTGALRPESYPYTVAVGMDEDVFIDDPEVIVDPDGDGENGG